MAKKSAKKPAKGPARKPASKPKQTGPRGKGPRELELGMARSLSEPITLEKTETLTFKFDDRSDVQLTCAEIWNMD